MLLQGPSPVLHSSLRRPPTGRSLVTIIISRAPDGRKFALEPTAFCW